jgi:hypothetical protein
VVGAGFARGPSAAEHEQALVAGIGDGMDALGEYGRGAGEEERHELGDRHSHIGGQRRESCLM